MSKRWKKKRRRMEGGRCERKIKKKIGKEIEGGNGGKG